MKIRFSMLIALLCIQISSFSMYDCDCNWEIDIVCIQTDDGNIVPFPNACWASCLGFNESEFIDCNYDITFDPVCGCTSDVEPVCVDAPSGEIILFPNSCLAECAGYTEDDFLGCNYDLPTNPNCGCDYNVDEVCVEIEEGIYMPFLNPCWADCVGYTEDSYLDCGIIFSDEDVAEEAAQYFYGLILDDTFNLSEEELPELNQSIPQEDLLESSIKRLTIFPNPVDGNELNLKMNITESGDFRIDLMSITGKLYKSLTHSIDNEFGLLKIQVNDLPEGVYYLNVYSGKSSSTLKFVKK